MKKFSKITGEKINEAPIIKKEVSPEDQFRRELYAIMDSHLKVQFIGPIEATFGGSMKVAGKEPFVEALLELINTKTTNEKIRVVESLKSEINDWQLLDKKMDQIKFDSINEEKISILKIHKDKLENFYIKYKGNETLLNKKLDMAISRMKDGKKAFYRHLAAEEMSKPGSGFSNKLFKEISNKYLLKSKGLGYNR